MFILYCTLPYSILIPPIRSADRTPRPMLQTQIDAPRMIALPALWTFLYPRIVRKGIQANRAVVAEFQGQILGNPVDFLNAE